MLNIEVFGINRAGERLSIGQYQMKSFLVVFNNVKKPRNNKCSRFRYSGLQALNLSEFWLVEFETLAQDD